MLALSYCRQLFTSYSSFSVSPWQPNCTKASKQTVSADQWLAGSGKRKRLVHQWRGKKRALTGKGKRKTAGTKNNRASQETPHDRPPCSGRLSSTSRLAARSPPRERGTTKQHQSAAGPAASCLFSTASFSVSVRYRSAKVALAHAGTGTGYRPLFQQCLPVGASCWYDAAQRVLHA